MLVENRTVLQHFLCREFGYPDTSAILSRLDGANPNICSYRDSDYATALYLGATSDPVVTPNQMIEYDRRLSKHNETLARSAVGCNPWTPLLYLTLLFAERYLDRYFNDAEKLRDDLNLARHEIPSAQPPPEYTWDDLRALTVSNNADGSESHLALFRVLQYRHWVKRLNNILLLTPDQTTVAQQEHNFAAGRIRARAFHPKADTPPHPTVEIIELRQFGPATDFSQPLRVLEFGLNTLVLVDETHMGAAASRIWRKLRAEFLTQGFVCWY